MIWKEERVNMYINTNKIEIEVTSLKSQERNLEIDIMKIQQVQKLKFKDSGVNKIIWKL